MANSASLPAHSVRKSGIELLRIIAVFLIIISHCTQTMENTINYHIVSTDYQFWIFDILRNFGSIGNIIFLICSSYFLVDSTRAKKEKILNLLLDSQAISILWLVFTFFLSLVFNIGIGFSVRQVLRCCFPEVFGILWFIPIYACLYLAHPFLNRIIHSISQRQHFAICFWILVCFSLLHLAKISIDSSNTLCFFWIYFIVAYMKKYCPEWVRNQKANLYAFLFFLFLFVGIVLLKRVLSFRNEGFLHYPDISGNMSIIFLPMCLSLFNLFLGFNFHNRLINFLSGCSLFVYCIHESIYMRELFRPKFYSVLIEKFGMEYLLVYVLILISIVAVFGFAAAVLYKVTIHKLTAKISPWLKNKISFIVNTAFSVCEKFLHS